MRQVNYVQAFPHAYLPEGKNVFMEIADGYDMGDKNKDEYCLQLVKNCYRLKQAAYNWNNLLKAGILSLGFKQSEQPDYTARMALPEWSPPQITL